MKPDDILVFESQEAFNESVVFYAQQFSDIADEWVTQKILAKQHEFKCYESIRIRDGRKMFYIDAPFDFKDGKVFIDEEVKINGKTYTIAGIERHCVSLMRKGTVIGLLVK